MTRKKILTTLAMMEALAGHPILQRPTITRVPKHTKNIKTGMRNKICPKCKHKNKKCACN